MQSLKSLTKARFITKKKHTVFIPTHCLSIIVYQKLNPIKIEINHITPTKENNIKTLKQLTQL